MTRLLAWWHAGQLKRLEANARNAATVYQMAKAGYENALIAERMKGEEL